MTLIFRLKSQNRTQGPKVCCWPQIQLFQIYNGARGDKSFAIWWKYRLSHWNGGMRSVAGHTSDNQSSFQSIPERQFPGAKRQSWANRRKYTELYALAPVGKRGGIGPLGNSGGSHGSCSGRRIRNLSEACNASSNPHRGRRNGEAYTQQTTKTRAQQQSTWGLESGVE